jgi:hypothetical protein
MGVMGTCNIISKISGQGNSNSIQNITLLSVSIERMLVGIGPVAIKSFIGDWYYTGPNPYGLMGNGNLYLKKGETINKTIFTYIPNLSNFNRGYIGEKLSIFRDGNNKWYFAGDNEEGAFGNGTLASPFLTNTDFGFTGRPFIYQSTLSRHIIFFTKNITCFGIEENSPQVCSSNGYCKTPNLCVCNGNYGGLNCEIIKCFGLSSTAGNVCSGRGACSSYNNCTCSPNYSGENCQYVNCFGFSTNSSSVCSGNGNCTAPNTCQCNEGYYGTSCSLQTPNKVYASGKNSQLMFGIGNLPSSVINRVFISSLITYDIIQISCTDKSCFALTSNSILLGSGKNGIFYNKN